MRHEHDWQPLHGWSGRYRCESCWVLGYRGIVIPGANEDDAQDDRVKNVAGCRLADIIPYRCATSGCMFPAIGRNPRNYCRRHSPHKKRKERGMLSALWVGGPPGSTFKSLASGLEAHGVAVVEHWTKDDGVMRKTRVPEVDVILINRDMIGHGEEAHVLNLAKKQEVRTVAARTSTTMTVENMMSAGFEVTRAEEEEEVETPKEDARPSVAPISTHTKKLVETKEVYVLADVFNAAGIKADRAIFTDGETTLSFDPTDAVVTVETVNEEIENG